MFEKPGDIRAALRTIMRYTDHNILSNTFVAFLFMHTGPIAILLSAAQAGGLAESEMISWLFAGYGIGGVITVLLSLLYRQPFAVAWSLPAAAIMGASLQHLSFPQVVGAYLITGLIITTISLTGLTRKAMDLIPIPIVMGMVAGLFLPFCLKLVTTFTLDPLLAAVTIAAFLLVTSGALPAKFVPSVLLAAIAGIIVSALRGDFSAVQPLSISMTRPLIYLPEFNAAAILELVLPLTVSVIGIQNTQGIAILRSEGYDPPVNVMTMASGLGSLAMGILGSVPACITGPVSALLNSSGEKKARYTGSFYLGCLMILSALFAPVAIGLALLIPANLIALLGGLALLKILMDSFQSAFQGKFLMGALVSFLVTVSNITAFNIGSAFWGLIAGCLISYITEPSSFRENLSPPQRKTV